MPSPPLSFQNRLTCVRVSLTLVADDGTLQSPKRANHEHARPLQTPEVDFVASPSATSAAALRLLCRGILPVSEVRLMLLCVLFACQRLAIAPADKHMPFMSWSWAQVVMQPTSLHTFAASALLLSDTKQPKFGDEYCNLFVFG